MQKISVRSSKRAVEDVKATLIRHSPPFNLWDDSERPVTINFIIVNRTPNSEFDELEFAFKDLRDRLAVFHIVLNERL